MLRKKTTAMRRLIILLLIVGCDNSTEPEDDIHPLSGHPIIGSWLNEHALVTTLWTIREDGTALKEYQWYSGVESWTEQSWTTDYDIPHFTTTKYLSSIDSSIVDTTIYFKTHYYSIVADTLKFNHHKVTSEDYNSEGFDIFYRQ